MKWTLSKKQGNKWRLWGPLIKNPPRDHPKSEVFSSQHHLVLHTTRFPHINWTLYTTGFLHTTFYTTQYLVHSTCSLEVHSRLTSVSRVMAPSHLPPESKEFPRISLPNIRAQFKYWLHIWASYAYTVRLIERPLSNWRTSKVKNVSKTNKLIKLQLLSRIQ